MEFESKSNKWCDSLIEIFWRWLSEAVAAWPFGLPAACAGL